MQQFLTVAKDWWPLTALGILGLLWQTYEMATKVVSALRHERNKAEPIKLQYTAIYVRVTHVRPKDVLIVELVVHLDNPTPYPIKISQVRMLTTMLYLNTDDIPADYQSLVLAPHTRKVRIQSRPIELPAKKGRNHIRGYVEWQIKYGRADIGPFEFTETFNLRGDIEARLVNGGWETHWVPFEDSELIVEEENTQFMVDKEGQFSRRRQDAPSP